jgi:hypothetical protein
MTLEEVSERRHGRGVGPAGDQDEEPAVHWILPIQYHASNCTVHLLQEIFTISLRRVYGCSDSVLYQE